MLSAMDPQMIKRHLAQAEQHVAEGEKHLIRQRELIAKLERDGHDTKEATAFLEQLEEMQGMHVADRDRLKNELRNADRT